MKGLILNNLYSVERSIRFSTFLSIILIVGLLLIQQSFSVRIAAFLPFLLIPVNAFEVLKLDQLSGWNKFEITLPVKRHQIILSKYVIFLLLFLLGAILSILLFYIIKLFISFSFTLLFFNYLLRGMGMVLCLAVIVYPLTFILGTEKSDIIMLCSMGFAFSMYGLVFALLQLTAGSIDNFDIIFSMSFLSISIILLIMSYVVSTIVYKHKEF